jgi:hypothetical protein
MYPSDDTEARLRLAARTLADLRERLRREIEWSRVLRAMVEESRRDWKVRYEERNG